MKFERPDWNQNSPHAYGLLSLPDVAFWESILDEIARRFQNKIRLWEIGVANGATCYGTVEYCERKNYELKWTGVDLPGVGPKVLPPNCIFLEGPSEEVYIKLQADHCNLLFIDGCHCSNHVVMDFCNYGERLEYHGLCVFHDSVNCPSWVGMAGHSNYQGHGPRVDDFGIGVRMGLRKLGLLDGLRKDWKFFGEQTVGTAQGAMAFERVL